ncbi:SGNH/GDSL hydrolase family protein [Paucihalobacter ruber]|uniref:SGNH/GDSL hydrolase family protein n=1 Tax=Paucihalobacter ruber TaxID=2567861 RepID=A0A506PLX9_9FLAO|nr:SGNH/GDSL hydrolase family protein [Paucihalobacter ruber]TPV34614.1 SGNH/GDSL hydrolase family protein [Paucihalobacter ruber]
MNFKQLLGLLLSLFFVLNCANNAETYVDPIQEEVEEEVQPNNFKLLSLGDSYTIGASVCETCRFPEQLKDSLRNRFDESNNFSLQIVATSGWTTTNLISALNSNTPTNDHDLVTLLIGVNNQFQGKPFELYETEFVILVNKAITYAKGDKSRIIVVSIPDYGFTPFGQNNQTTITAELDNYNAYAQNYCEANNISYVYITDITQQGLENPNLVASDGLHPSELAYSKFVERILPKALQILQQ